MSERKPNWQESIDRTSGKDALAKMKAHRDRYAAKCDRLTAELATANVTIDDLLNSLHLVQAELEALKAKLPLWIEYTKDSRDIGILVSEMQAAAKGGEG